MPFNFQTFLDNYGIPYITKGPNVARGNINIKCIYCGTSDPSEHLGINLATGKWGCWRNARHRGVSATRLVRVLLSCTQAEAELIVRNQPTLKIRTLEGIKARLTAKERPMLAAKERFLQLPPEIKPLMRPGSQTKRTYSPKFWSYLRRRGFTNDAIDYLIERYDLHYCMVGKFKYRLIFPVSYNDRLVSWTGRTIHHMDKMRYLSASEVEGALPLPDYVLGYDWLNDTEETKPNHLVITEGPLDAAKLQAYGARFGLNATCLFTANITREQINKIRKLVLKYKRTYVMLDSGKEGNALAISQLLQPTKIHVLKTPKPFDDPGELTKQAVRDLAIYLDNTTNVN